MNEIELAILLGFYYIGKEKNAEKFTKLFNSCFGRDIGIQTVLHEISVFRIVDPKNNVAYSPANSNYYEIWNKYIGSDRVIDLKKLYKAFWDGDFIPQNIKQKHIEDPIPITELSIHDEPKEVAQETEHTSLAIIRDRTVANNALALAGNVCEGRCSNILFLKKDGKTNYTEAHHLIPLKYQYLFNYSLDVEANIVSLCPMCHRKLHYGIDYVELLTSLYDQRKGRLAKCGIIISLEKLILLYASCFLFECELQN